MLTALFILFSIAFTLIILTGAIFGDTQITITRKPEPIVYYFNPEYTQQTKRSYAVSQGYKLAVNA